MRVLVLGSSGVVGRALVEQLSTSGHDVVEWDIKIRQEHDLTNQANMPSLKSVIGSCDFVFFLAYDVGGSKYLSKPTIEFMNNNSRLMMNTFSFLEGKKFIFASSTMSNMDVAYGALKMVGEHYTKILGGVVARFWNVYGIQQAGQKSYALNDFVHSFVSTGTVKLLSSGHERRQFLNSKDCAKCLETMMMRYESMKPVVDVSSFEWISIYDAAKMICDEVTRGHTAGDSHSFNNEPDDFILQYWRPTIALKHGIEELIHHTRAETCAEEAKA